MKRISTQKNSFLKRLIINIPFVLIVALMAVCFLGGAVLFIYSVVTAVAFHSAMISLLLVGAGLILIGCGVALISAFKKYYAFYDLKMGWVYPDRPSPAEKAPAKDATSTSFKKPLKAYFSLSTISIVALAIGSLFTIISAALGCVDYDHMGIGDDFSPSLKSLNTFKTKFSKEVRPVAPNRDVPLRKAFYQTLVAAKGLKTRLGR